MINNSHPSTSSTTSRKQATDPVQKAGAGNSVTKRLQSELKSLMVKRKQLVLVCNKQMSGDAGISAFPEGENLFSWAATITGANGTVYEGLTYKLSIKFPSTYPYTAPTVKFETACFHPNVDQYGNICLDILKDKWSAVYNVRTVLLSIQSLLGEPNNDSPLNGQAAALWENQDARKKYAEAEK